MSSLVELHILDRLYEDGSQGDEPFEFFKAFIMLWPISTFPVFGELGEGVWLCGKSPDESLGRN